jgi:DNA-binding NtrC family response regulator
VLVVDDDESTRRVLQHQLELEGHEILLAPSTSRARELLREDLAIDAVLLDVVMPDREGGGLNLLAELSEQRPSLPVIMVTSSDEVQNAVFALRHGAFDYLVKPAPKAELTTTVHNAVSRHQMTRELHALRALNTHGFGPDEESVFAGAAVRQAMGVLAQVKDSRVPVLIRGESGTGKEVAARWLHRKGRRAGKPFVAVNCATLTHDLAASELFGHERGAFVGAVGRRIGRFEEADGGTLLLDEAGELDLSVQAQLLRTLQEGTITRVGGDTLAVDVRVVVATHRDLAARVKTGEFREDLYYRLDVIQVEMPPLRERLEELPALSMHLLQRFAASEGLPPKRLSAEALGVLAQHSWPGNVRELENTLKRSALLTPGDEIGADSLRLRLPGPLAEQARPSEPPREPLHKHARTQVEPSREVILEALAQAGGNVSEAARRLGIGRATFYRWSRRFAPEL